MSKDCIRKSTGWHIVKDHREDVRACDGLLKRLDVAGGTQDVA